MILAGIHTAPRMRYYQDVEDLNSLRAIVTQDLKELGVKPPKTKKKSKDEAVSKYITYQHRLGKCSLVLCGCTEGKVRTQCMCRILYFGVTCVYWTFFI